MSIARSITVIMRSGLALALALTIWSPTQPRAAESLNEKPMTENTMMEHCAEIKARKQKLKYDLEIQRADVADRIATMNRAPTDQKLTLLAAIVTQMAEQKTIMDERKAKMDEHMMKHMMEHMSMNKGAMTKCPMMIEMNELKPSSDPVSNDHNEPRVNEPRVKEPR